MAYQYKARKVLNIYSGWCTSTETIWRQCMQKKQTTQYRKTKCRLECRRNYNHCWTWFGVLQDKHCTYNVTVRRVHVTIVAVEKQFLIPYSDCMFCNLIYPACTVHAPIILSIVSCLGFPYFSALSHRRHAFRKKTVTDIKCVLVFFTTFVWKISHTRKNSTRYCYICT
jgi:hypothetical protein